jgi:secretion/DNA translocation related CpaE-like protein
VTLVDADRLGVGIEHVAGIEEEGAGWGSLLESAGRLGSRALRSALPQRDGLAVLGWGHGGRPDLDPLVAREAVSAAQRGCRLVVVDLPRYAGAATGELLARCGDLVLVVPAHVAAVTASMRVVADAVPQVPRAHLVVRGGGSALDPEQVADALGLPLAASMSDQRRLAEAVALGLGPMPSRRGPLARAARATLGHLDVPAPARTRR